MKGEQIMLRKMGHYFTSGLDLVICWGVWFLVSYGCSFVTKTLAKWILSAVTTTPIVYHCSFVTAVVILELSIAALVATIVIGWEQQRQREKENASNPSE